MNKPLTIECAFHVGHEAKGRKELLPGGEPAVLPPGRVPRVAKLLALAHRFERLLHDGVVRDYADLAQLGQVTRARVSQILALLCLAPDLQEAILFLPPTVRGRDRVQMRHVLPIAAVADWKKQRQRWRELHERPLA
jgi:integrase